MVTRIKVGNIIDKQIVDMKDDLDWSYQTIRLHINEGTYPAEMCLKIQELSKGVITAVQLRPDLFTPTNAQRKLALAISHNAKKLIDSDNANTVICLLNYFENQCPDLYKITVKNICKTKVGKELISQRLAHLQIQNVGN